MVQQNRHRIQAARYTTIIILIRNEKSAINSIKLGMIALLSLNKNSELEISRNIRNMSRKRAETRLQHYHAQQQINQKRRSGEDRLYLAQPYRKHYEHSRNQKTGLE
jgi:hypothetical protein